MRGSSKPVIAPRWLPFLGKKMGLAKGLSVLSVDPDEFDLHHVFPAATSLNRLLGRSGEFEARAGGAGIRLADAINRAMGELVERYASLAFDGPGRIVCSRKTLLSRGCRAVPLGSLALFSPEQLAAPGFAYAEFTEDTTVGWIEGTNLADGSPAFVPGQLVSLGYLPGPDEVSPCFYPTSSGCALASSVEGAVLAGLLESIERDAVMIRWYARMAPPRLDLDPAALLGRPLGPQKQGLEIRFHDMTVDGDVPIVSVTCIERTGRPCFFLLSAAAGLDTLTAARKALVEAGQGRPFIKLLANLGPAASENHEFRDFDSNLRFYGEPANARYTEWFFQNMGAPGRYFSEVRGVKDAAGLLRVLLDRCSTTGITPIAFDLTTPEIRDCGLFACRVFVPELVPLCVPSAPFLGHPRLARFVAAAERDGSAGCIPRWLPHPFP
jgi:ribosomal protein S12 methylthiotransferase accessory factor